MMAASPLLRLLSFGLTLSIGLYFVSAFLPVRTLLSLLVNSAIIGGTLSGSLHALTGSDHLAALLPLIVGKRWWQGSAYGGVWGIGHGLTSGAIGLLSYKMKSYFLRTSELFQVYGYVVDGVVGVTLVVIGVMGLYEGAHEEQEPPSAGKDTNGIVQKQNGNHAEEASEDAFDQEITACGEHCVDLESAAPVEATAICTKIPECASSSQRPDTVLARSLLAAATVFANGCILGVSWDGLPSLAPAVVLEDWPLYLFLGGYALGTAVTMGFAAGLVAETTCWISRVAKVNVSERLASVSSLCAIIIGALWVVSGALKCAHRYYHSQEDGYGALSMHDLHDGTGMAVSLGAAENNDNLSGINNDTFQEHALGAGWSLLLGGGSVCAVVGVVVYATQCELGGVLASSWVGKQPERKI